jgi:hypothetical protein
MRCAYASDAASPITAPNTRTATVLAASLAPADDRDRPQYDDAVEAPNLSTETDQAQARPRLRRESRLNGARRPGLEKSG